MENRSKKSSDVEVSKRNRSLDLKSLYQSKVSGVEESKNKVPAGNDLKDVQKKKRKNRKEASLSRFESDAKKSRKEDGNGLRSETGFDEKLSGGSNSSQGISMTPKSHAKKSSKEDGNGVKSEIGSGKKSGGSNGIPMLEAKKSRKEDVNGGKSEVGSGKKLGGGSNSSHGISLSLGAKKIKKEDVNGAKSEIGSRKKMNGGSTGLHGLLPSLKSNSKGSRKDDISGGRSEIGLGKKMSGGSNGFHGISHNLSSDAKKIWKEDVNGARSETGFDKKLSGGSNGSHGISLSSKSNAKKSRKDDVNGAKSEIASDKKISGRSNGLHGNPRSLKSDSKERRKEEKNVAKSEIVTGKKMSGGSNGSPGISLSLKSDANKSEKDDVNGAKSENGSVKKMSSGSNVLHGSSLSLIDNATGFKIPRRPRDSVGRKKPESDQLSKLLGCSVSVDCVGPLNINVIKSKDDSVPNNGLVKFGAHSAANDVISNSISAGKGNHSNSKSSQKADSKSAGKVNLSNSNSGRKADSKSTGKECLSNSKSSHKADSKSAPNLNLKRKAGVDKVKESRNVGSASVLNAEKEENLVVTNGDRPSKKQRTDSRKKKDLNVGRDDKDNSTKKTEPSVDSIVFIDLVDDDDDEEEENLEQNAARMLSSRFDPSCTGFPSKIRTTTNNKPSGLSFPVSPTLDSSSQKPNFSGGEESASADDKNKPFGPRKRRHFYEILPSDLESSLVLDRRIKIFWPLDESWYDGLVINYHVETNLYHVKYDDRDEEWVDLREEKFKLLLFPSEVPDKAKRRRRKSRNEGVNPVKTVSLTDGDSCVGNNLDSEPIASWLVRPTQRVKSSPKPRTSQMHLPVSLPLPLPSDKTGKSHSDGDVSDSHTAKNLADHESAMSDILVADEGVDKSLPAIVSNSQNRKLLVYSRKRYKKKSEGSSSVSTKDNTFIKRYENLEKQLWSIDDKGDLSFNAVLVASTELRMQICLPVFSILEFSNVTEDFWLLHKLLMLQHGTVVTTSPAVKMEIFLIDSSRGLRILLFEGCLMQALAFIFLIMVVFNQPDEQWNGDLQLPVTSINFRLSSVLDLRKHHVFAFYSFSGLQCSKWKFLDSKLLHHCLLIKQLQVSECTYENIKNFDIGTAQPRKSHIGLDVSSVQACKKKYVSGILPMGLSKKARSKRMSLSTFNLAAEPREVHQFALSFSAAPTFFRDLHLQLLMQHSFAWVNLQHNDTLCPIENSENGNYPVGENDTQFKPNSVHVDDVAAEENFETLETEQDLGTDVLASNSRGRFESSQDLELHKGNRDGPGNENLLEIIAQSSKVDQTFNPKRDSRFGGMIVDISSSDQVHIPSEGKGCISRQTSDMDWNPTDDFAGSPNPTGSRSSSRQARSASISSLLGNLSPVFPNGKANLCNGFSSGPKKPRTQVRYTLPFTGYDFSEKQKMQNPRSLPYKRIRRASLKKLSDESRSNQKNFEMLSCSANVLVTLGDKGWREYGAQVFLESVDPNEWRLAVKFSGVTKYSYKVKQILQPGSTNRFSHAMMWKGGKDWLLEFPDRSQWMLFKEMHEECYNLNIRAASLKNIPIPGVYQIEEKDDCGTKVPFVRNSVMYFRQDQNDIQMAMDHSRVLYDMDSDDEQWFLANKTCDVITEELLEKTIGLFEKVAYIQKRDNFTDSEIEELVIGIGSAEAAKAIYEYWRQKRESKGMPLIRHLQPPHWERYQQQLKEWEHTIARGTSAISVPPPEKPPMFAFCLKPRGLEVPNKSFKQRSHKRYSVSGHNHATSGDPNTLIGSGRRSNGRTFGDGKVVYQSSLHEYSNVSPSLQASRKVLSPRDAQFSLSDVAEWNHDRKINGNKPNKFGSNSSYYNQRTGMNGNELQQWNVNSAVLSNLRQYHYKQGMEQLEGAELSEFQLRDVSGVAEHAAKMAKFKREKAQKLLNRADLTIHKAVVALMTAEAIKAAVHEKSNGDN